MAILAYPYNIKWFRIILMMRLDVANGAAYFAFVRLLYFTSPYRIIDSIPRLALRR